MSNKEIDGFDLINVFDGKLGLMGLCYLIQSYYHPSSFVSGKAEETAYNEGKRAVVINLIDSMRAADPKITAKMLSDVEYMILESKTKRKTKDNTDDVEGED